MSEVKTSKVEQRLEKLGLWIEKYIAPPLVKVGSQRHIVAIRAALLRVIPLIIVGSVPLILTNLPVESWANFMQPYADSLNTLFAMSFGFMSLYLAFCLGAELSKMYKELDATTVGIITVACFLITVTPVNLADGVIDVGPFSASGMFAAFLCAIIVTEVMHLMISRNWTIRMPKQVPQNVAASFSSLVPMAVLLVLFWFLRIILNFNIYELLNIVISPLLVISDTWYAVLIAALLLQILWFCGIHGGSFTIWGVLYPFLLANMAANAAAAAAGTAIPHIFNEPFVFTWIMIGGTGSTLPLVIYWWRSKSTVLRKVGRISLIPGLFCINETVIFGAPMVLNPLMFIPFVFLTSVFGAMYGYVLTAIGWVSPAIVATPWTTPPLLQPFISTGGDWRAVVAQAVLIVLLFIIWIPFGRIWEKRMLIQEQGETAAETASAAITE